MLGSYLLQTTNATEVHVTLTGHKPLKINVSSLICIGTSHGVVLVFGKENHSCFDQHI